MHLAHRTVPARNDDAPRAARSASRNDDAPCVLRSASRKRERDNNRNEDRSETIAEREKTMQEEVMKGDNEMKRSCNPPILMLGRAFVCVASLRANDPRSPIGLLRRPSWRALCAAHFHMRPHEPPDPRCGAGFRGTSSTRPPRC